MSNLKFVYAAPAGITISLASLAASAVAGRECTAINNSSDGYIDAYLYLALKLQAGDPPAGAAIQIYLGMSHDGSNFTDNLTGADAAITLRQPTNLIQAAVGAIWTPTTGGLTWKGTIPSIAKAFGDIMPPYWSVVVVNNTGIALSATEGDHTKQFVGIKATYA